MRKYFRTALILAAFALSEGIVCANLCQTIATQRQILASHAAWQRAGRR